MMKVWHSQFTTVQQVHDQLVDLDLLVVDSDRISPTLLFTCKKLQKIKKGWIFLCICHCNSNGDLIKEAWEEA
jgi:hypothetical protein